jgi:NAD(P)-dependent dehydrogenase (short-subunit alcohol dehydrogenase family)
MTDKTWLITGAGGGITRAALAARHITKLQQQIDAARDFSTAHADAKAEA